MSQRTNFIWELIITSAAITGIFPIDPAGWIILSLCVVLGIVNVVAYKRGTLEKMNEAATKRFRLVGNIALAAFVSSFGELLKYKKTIPLSQNRIEVSLISYMYRNAAVIAS